MLLLEGAGEAVSYLTDAGLSTDRVLVIGGGSNILFTGDYEGIVLRFEGKGMEVISEDEDHVIVKIAAGEDWDEAVEKCLGNGWYGLENLSLIPGNVGAAPVQNIGAYGVELAGRVLEVEAVGIEKGIPRVFSADECRFGYRDSIFKREMKGEYLIVGLVLKLDKVFAPVLSYAVLADYLSGVPSLQITPERVRQAVIEIRRSKLPDPEETGNAGSFFKNPVVEMDKFVRIRDRYPDAASFPQGNGRVKISAGWMIEKCGLKGFRRGDAGIHDKQALVIVNHGAASGKDILDLARTVAGRVKEKFDIDLQREVNIF